MSLKLKNDADIPIVGLGTWKSKPNQVENAVKVAIACGYRHIDCAFVYGNEKEVGSALKSNFDNGTLKREDIFITSKLWNTFHHPEDVEKACQTSLGLLGLDYLDLYLIHWPMAYKRGGNLVPKDEAGKTIFDEDISYTATWKSMEELVTKGLCKAIGLSNFNQQQIEDIMALPNSVPIAVNQIELHPYLCQESLVAFCKNKGIVVTAYSPLGSGDRPWAKKDDPSLMTDPKLLEISSKYKKSPAQILIRFAIERNLVVIPKSVTPERIVANLETMNFELKPEDIDVLKDLNRNYRVCGLPWNSDHKHHPFPEAQL